jgi:hypothetical protein
LRNSRSQGWNKEDRAPRKTRGKKGAPARNEGPSGSPRNEPADDFDDGYGKSTACCSTLDTENMQRQGSGVQHKSLAERITHDAAPQNTQRLETATSHSHGNTGRIPSAYPTSPQIKTTVQKAESDIKAALPTSIKVPTLVAKRPAARIVGPASSITNKVKTTTSTANVLPMPSIAHPTSPVDSSSTPITTNTSTTTFRIPPQSTFSDIDFYFLISKLRGREVSIAEWDDAVKKVQGIRFGSNMPSPKATMMMQEEEEVKEVKNQGKDTVNEEVVTMVEQKSSAEKGKGKAENRLSAEFRRLMIAQAQAQAQEEESDEL